MLLLVLCCAFFLSDGDAHKTSAVNKECIGGGDTVAPLISLRPDMYSATCPYAEAIVFSIVEQVVAAEPRMAASLLRLHFHDCFVHGCDGSVLLDNTQTFTGEKTAPPNVNSLRGFDVVDSIKLLLEDACPGTVSCADLLAIAARDSVVASGGPTWQVEMGRRDSLTADPSLTRNIPSPNSTLAILLQKFMNVGLSQTDMVALSGGHTIGKARCISFASSLSSTPPTGDLEFRQSMQQLCMGGNSTLAHLDLGTPETFDNQYFVNLISGQGLLPSDQALMEKPEGEVAALVRAYASDMLLFFDNYAVAMVRMGRLAPPTGAGGEVRRNCRVVN